VPDGDAAAPRVQRIAQPVERELLVLVADAEYLAEVRDPRPRVQRLLGELDHVRVGEPLEPGHDRVLIEVQHVLPVAGDLAARPLDCPALVRRVALELLGDDVDIRAVDIDRSLRDHAHVVQSRRYRVDGRLNDLRRRR